MSLPIGSQKRSTDGVIGTSGHAIRVYQFIVNADASGAVVAVYDGTSTGGTAMDSLVGAASLSTRIPYAGGLLFPNGCYLDVDSHTNYVVAIYSQES